MLSKAKLKLYQQLTSKKFRQKYGLFVVEGLKSVNELTQSNWPVETILCTPAFLERYGEQIDFTFDLISSEEFAATSHLTNPQEILAIACDCSLGTINARETFPLSSPSQQQWGRIRSDSGLF